MFKKNKEVIEMEQTTFIQKHAKKILLVGGVVVAAGTCYVLRKHDIDLKNKDELIEKLVVSNETLKENNETLMAAASEGLFEEALSKVANKINHRLDRKEFLEKQLEKGNKEVIPVIEKVSNELTVLFARRDKFTKAQVLLEIKDLD